MAENTVDEIENEYEEVESGTSHGIEGYIEDNKQKVLIIGGVLLLIIAALVFLFAKFLPERNLKAQREMYLAEMAFAKDSFNLALNGNTTTKGFLEIKKKYSFTKAAKLADYYIGICYLNQKKYKEAIDYLEDFSTSDPILGATNYNAMGDAYAELNKPEDAIKYYTKAVNFSDNDQFAPFFLLKLGQYQETNKKFKEAKETFEKIKDKYPNADESRDAERCLARVSAQL